MIRTGAGNTSHESVRCVPETLLICKVAVTEWNLPQYHMECTYTACGTLFDSIRSQGTVKLLIRCACNQKNRQSNNDKDRCRQHIA